MSKLNKNLVIVSAMLVFFSFLGYYTYLSSSFPSLFNVDNHLNVAATEYLLEHREIPVVVADQPGIAFTNLGTSRSLRPPFTYIVSALLARATEPFIVDEEHRLKMGSVLIAALTITVIFVGYFIAFEHIGLAILGAALIGLLPRFVFLATCNNDDVGAIFSGSLLFFSMLSLHKYGLKAWVFYFSALSIGVVLQTKFTAWLLLPWLMVYLAISMKVFKLDWSALIPKLLIGSVLVVLAGAWWPIFNMINYGIGDPTAMAHAAAVQVSMVGSEASNRGYWSLGVTGADLLLNHDDFLAISYRSMIGYLSWIELEVGCWSYWFYASIFIVSLLGSLSLFQPRFTGQRAFIVLVLMIVISQLGFYVHHNLARDVQPQARYILPVVMPLVFLFLSVLQRVSFETLKLYVGRREHSGLVVVISILVLVSVSSHIMTMQRAVFPSYQSKPYYLSWSGERAHKVDDILKVFSASGIRYLMTDDKLSLVRDSAGHAEVEFNGSLCNETPVNASINFRIYSKLGGSVMLNIYGSTQKTHPQKHWQSYKSGEQTLRFLINASSCMRTGLMFGKRTNAIEILGVTIQQLKIHDFGRPL